MRTLALIALAGLATSICHAADTEFIKPGVYWKCPADEKPGANRKPGWSVRLQGRYSLTQDGPDLPTWSVRDDHGSGDGYNTRRIRISYDQQFNRDWVAFAQIHRDWGAEDFEFNDLYLTYRGWQAANVTVGQMMTPYDRQFLSPDPQLPLAERPRAGILLIPDRDIGILLHSENTIPRLGWYLGLYTGNGRNELTTAGTPMPVARVEYAAAPGLNLGLQWAQRQGHAVSNFEKFLKKNGKAYDLESHYAAGELDEDMWGLDALYKRDGLSVWAGYNALDVSGAGQNVDADGWWVHAGQFVPYRGRRDRLEFVAGYEEFDPNAAVTDHLDCRWLTFGLNYHVVGCKQQWRLQYVIRDEGRDEGSDNTLLLEYDYLMSW